MKIGFVSERNAVRSIFAEALAKKYLRELGLRAEVFSAGVDPAKEVHPLTLKVLEERGIPTRGLYPKDLSRIPYKKLDVLITIGEEAKEKCEFVISHKRRESWNIEKPSDDLNSFRKVFDQIESSIRELFKVER